MPTLDWITVKGFKSIASIERLPLRAINIVIGANGSGKSNFIGAFSLLHALREGQLQDYVARAGGANRLLHFGAKITPEIELELSFVNEVNQYRIALIPTAVDELVPKPEGEWALFWNKAQYPNGPFGNGLHSAGKEAGISQPQPSGIASYVRERLTRWRAYHFHDTSSLSPLKQTSDVADNRLLRGNGSNLAAFLYLLKQQFPEQFGLIRAVVRQVSPFFDDFQLEPQLLNPSKIRLEWKHAGSDAYFDASSFSDGTLRFIALATLLLQPESLRPSVILIDEPELGLHPYAITMLASLIQQASVDTQMVVSTQSPQLLDNFEPDDVLVAERVGGGTQLKRLENEKLVSWLETYGLGQLWEKNELGGRPVGETPRA